MSSPASDALILRCPLPAGVGFRLEGLGTAAPTRLAGRGAVVHLPRLLGGEPVLVQPAVLDGLVEEPEYSVADVAEDAGPGSPWGWPTSWGSTVETTALAVTQVVITVGGVGTADAEAVVSKCIGAFPQWFRLLKDWVEVLTKQDLDYMAPRKRLELEGDRWAAWVGKADVEVSVRFIVDFDYGKPLHQARWARLLELVGAGSQPAVEHLLLRDARAAHVRRQYRQAVVDAATSLEIALHRLLLAEHRRDPTRLADELLRLAERWTLGTLQGTLERLGLTPPGVTADLVALRNSVVHKKAHEPTEAESTSMLQAATDASNTATPIDTAL